MFATPLSLEAFQSIKNSWVLFKQNGWLSSMLFRGLLWGFCDKLVLHAPVMRRLYSWALQVYNQPGPSMVGKAAFPYSLVPATDSQGTGNLSEQPTNPFWVNSSPSWPLDTSHSQMRPISANMHSLGIPGDIVAYGMSFRCNMHDRILPWFAHAIHALLTR